MEEQSGFGFGFVLFVFLNVYYFKFSLAWGEWGTLQEGRADTEGLGNECHLCAGYEIPKE